MSTLYYGDNLDVMRRYLADESVDLVYLDPPFNSNRGYNVLFAESDKAESEAQIRAFEDTWHWDETAERTFRELTASDAEERGFPARLVTLVESLRAFLGSNDMLAYLVMMAVRLVELHRVLKPTGSLYLHCDPTASHYLKLVLDGVFGPESFQSEIIWRRYGSHNDAKTYGAVHDTLLFYTKGKSFVFNKQHEEHSDEYVSERFKYADPDGRRWAEQNLSSPNPRPNLTFPYRALNGVTYQPPTNGWKCTPERMAHLDVEGRLHYPKKADGRLRLKSYLDELPGMPVQDMWTDISHVGGTNPERLGYPTQKPLELLERILRSSSNEGDVVLDPFCGCGTTIHAAQYLRREWIGIDITHLAVSLIRNRLETAFPGIEYEVKGEPVDIESARALAEADPFQFQWWALHLIHARPTGGGSEREGKRGRDRGIDGVIRFKDDPRAEKSHRIIVSVKAGKHLTPAMVRDLHGTIEREDAPIGVLLTMHDPTAEMRREAAKAGVWKSSRWDRGSGTRAAEDIYGESDYSKIQIITVEEAFSGKRVRYPGQDVTIQPAPLQTKTAHANLTLPGIEPPPKTRGKGKR